MQPAWITNKLSNLVAKNTAGGVVRAWTYYAVCSVLLLIGPAYFATQGVYVNTVGFWVGAAASILMVVFYSILEIHTLMKIGLAGCGIRYSMLTGIIEPTSDAALNLIFARPCVMGGSRASKFDSNIDVTPMLLAEPEGIVGEFNLKAGDSKILVENCRLEVVGFDRYRVTACEGLESPHLPHVSARISKQTDVIVIGKFMNDCGDIQPIIGSTILIIEASILERFIQYNMFRTLFLCTCIVILI